MAHVQDLINHFYSDLLIGQRALEGAIREAIALGGTLGLDAGCGIDAPLTRKFGEQIRVVGIDLCRSLPRDLSVVTGDLSKLPFPDETFSIIFSRSVFEHLTDPEQVMAEFERVLQPSGRCIILTPNRFDYSSIVAASTPQWFHDWFIRKVYDAAAYDTFPTVYRANTPRFFRSLVNRTGRWRIQCISGVRHYPANLAFSRLLFRLGIIYDRAIARLALTALQPSLLVVLEKKAQD
jgi:ubiquinone/menaquinone biosynthesis C-methylase UbiE